MRNDKVNGSPRMRRRKRLIVPEPPTVVNLRKSKYDIYIGRANGSWNLEQSIWHNPYPIGLSTSRLDVLDMYEIYIRDRDLLMERLPDLYDKVLGCWCKPLVCHGDVLAKLVQEELKQRGIR